MHPSRLAVLPLFLAACAADAALPTMPDDGAPPPGAPIDSSNTVTPSYEFGALFEPPAGRVVHGMGQWASGNASYTAMLPAGRQPATQLMFIDLGDTPRPWDPAEIATRLAAIHAQGRIPVLDLALRGLQPTPAELAQLEDQTYGIDSLVAFTSQFDGRIQSFVDVLKAHDHAVMLRIGGEFSGWWNGYHPYAFPVAFRKIVEMFRASGVTNVAFVWCYEPAAADDFDAVDANGNPKWYPGDDAVDWFSIDLFSAGDVGGPLTGHGAVTSFGKTTRFLDMAVQHRRPVIIAESSPSHYDLGDAAAAAASWTEWFAPYFDLVASRAEVKWFHYINYDWTTAGYYASSGWENNDLTASASVSAMYVAELGKARYLHAGEVGLLKGYR